MVAVAYLYSSTRLLYPPTAWMAVQVYTHTCKLQYYIMNTYTINTLRILKTLTVQINTHGNGMVVTKESYILYVNKHRNSNKNRRIPDRTK